MGNYSDDASMVRVDFFKPSGKWYCTEAVRWTGPYHSKDEATGKITLIHDAFAVSLAEHFTQSTDLNDLAQKGGRWRLEDMIAVCTEPYHERAHPLMVHVAHAKKAYEERIAGQ
jgi:hypothetical protein